LRSADLERLRAALDAAGHSQAMLSYPETLAALGCFEMPLEILTQFEHTL
jgi:hypothetical protein